MAIGDCGDRAWIVELEKTVDKADAALEKSGDRAWIVELGKTVDKAEAAVEMSRWQGHCIYRVPVSIKDRNPNAYRPQVVSLGPFYHGDEQLLPMEDHKRRAVGHFLRRTKKPLGEFAAAVEEVAEQLLGAYADLDERWRDPEGRKRFLEMLIVDGCFVLEVMWVARIFALCAYPLDYAPNDSIFSRHGMLYRMPYIRRDMLILENQLPMLLLETLVAAVARGQAFSDDDTIIKSLKIMVVMFLSPPTSVLPPMRDNFLPLHPLDLYRQSMVYDPDWKSHNPELEKTDVTIRSAVELYEAGIQFKKSSTDSLHNIQFKHGVLNIPPVSVDDSTEYVLLNMMAFEMLHVGAGNGVTAYVSFMDEVIRSDKDVALLTSKGIIRNAVGSDQAVVDLFRRVSKDAVLGSDSEIKDVMLREKLNAYCSKPLNKWRANIVRNYFRSPTSFINFIAASIILIMTVIQTIYAIVSFNKGQDKSSTTLT